MALSRAPRVSRLLAAAAVACAACWSLLGGVIQPVAASSQQASNATLQAGGETLEIRPNVYLIAGLGGNVVVQVGDDGVVVVDTGSAASAPTVAAAIARITPKPIRYIIDTGPDADHVGGNELLAKAGESITPASRTGANILAAEGVLLHLSAASGGTAPVAVGGWPNETFHYARKYMYMNGEAIEVLHQPAAHTDGDVFVFFRRSDVVAAGDVLDTRHFPVIDVDKGGTVEGEIAALNRLVDIAVPSVPIVSREAGTIVVPGHGHLYDQFDVTEYRDMITIVRDRVRDLMSAGQSLQQIQAAQPAKGYVGRYGKAGGDWTTERFIEAIYKSLGKGKR